MPTSLTRANAAALSLSVQAVRQPPTVPPRTTSATRRSSAAVFARLLYSLSSGTSKPATINATDEAFGPAIGGAPYYLCREVRSSNIALLAAAASETTPLRDFIQNWGA